MSAASRLLGFLAQPHASRYAQQPPDSRGRHRRQQISTTATACAWGRTGVRNDLAPVVDLTRLGQQQGQRRDQVVQVEHPAIEIEEGTLRLRIRPGEVEVPTIWPTSLIAVAPFEVPPSEPRSVNLEFAYRNARVATAVPAEPTISSARLISCRSARGRLPSRPGPSSRRQPTGRRD